MPNYDPDTGIHYGAIHQNSIEPEYLSEISIESRDLTFEAGIVNAKKALEAAVVLETEEERFNRLSEELKNYVFERYLDRRIADILEAETPEERWEIVEQDFSDSYDSGGSNEWLWEHHGYVLTDCLEFNIFVTKSPYFTYAPQCSPCVPNAGDLDNTDRVEPPGGLKTYCLGHDFFEGEQAPYPVFSVASGKEVVMQEVRNPCPTCVGGRRTVKSLADIREETEEMIILQIADDSIHVEKFDPVEKTFDCFRCSGQGFELARKPVEVDAPANE